MYTKMLRIFFHLLLLLLARCVNVLGKKKSLELLYATEDIQASGGMLTAVGVYTTTTKMTQQ